MQSTDALDARIRVLVAELIESAPQATEFVELDARKPLPLSGRRNASYRRIWVVGVLGVACLSMVLFVVLSGPVGIGLNEAAAAQLRQIAANASTQPGVELGANQWLFTTQRVSFFVAVSQVGSTPTPGVEATINATIQEWSNDFGQACASATAQPAQFASPSNREAWQSEGLLTEPAVQPVTGCSTANGASASNGLGRGVGVIDVSKLPTSPSVLAHELITGTTGIPGLDQLSSHDEDGGFVRAAAILVGPTTGATQAFYASLYDALALIPGVERLGVLTTHSGQSGLGFAAPGELGRSTIVVDPTSGVLLEARNIPDQGPFSDLEPAYLTGAPKPVGPIAFNGASLSVVIGWLDPIGQPEVVDASSLPAGVSPPAPNTGTIRAVGDGGTSPSQVLSLDDHLDQQIGGASSTEYESSALSGQPGGIFQWSFTGTTSQITAWANALRASGLFTSVTIKYSGGSPSP